MSKIIQLELEFKKGKTIDDLGDIADGINEIKSGAKGAGEGVGKFSKSFKAITKASGIVFLVEKAFNLLKETLGKNQKVLDGFNTAFEFLSIAFNDLFNFLDANVGTVIDYFKGIFSDPQQALKDLGNAIKDNLIERFNSALEVFGYLGTAIKKVFEGDFDGAMEAAKNAGKEYIDVLTGVDDSVDKIVEGTKEITRSITEYAKSTIKAAQSTVDLNKQAELAAVINQGLIEKYDRQAEQQRQIRDDESKTIEERIAANNKLGEILEEQQKLMLENVDITIRAAQAEYNKNKNQENLIALEEAQNERAAVLAQIEGFRSEQIINRISLEREVADLKKETDEAELERLEGLAKRKAEIEEQNRQQIYDTLDATIDAAGAETKIGRALFIAKQAILIKEQVMKAKATLQELGLILAKSTADTAAGAASTAKVGFPQNVPLLIAFAAQAAGIISSIKAAVNAAKGSAAAMGGGGVGGGGSAAPQAPSFNIVGAAPENQLAQAIGEKEDKPIKAFVVSNEVSNAQALDRNIVQGASIG